jgi:GAF domain-containing protein
VTWPLRPQLHLTVNDVSDFRSLVVEQLLNSVLKLALSATNARGGAIALSEGTEMICWAAEGIAPDLGTRLDKQSGFSAMCVRKCRILLCDDAETDPRVDRAACQRLGARSMIAVPLLEHGKLVGILEVFSGIPHAFDDDDIRHLDPLARAIVEAMADIPPIKRIA